MISILEKYPGINKYRDIILFLGRLLLILLAFYILIHLVKSRAELDRYFKTSGPVYLLSMASAYATRGVLTLAGYEAMVSYSYAYTGVIDQGVFVVNIPGSPGIWIGGHCLGLKLLSLFVILIAAFPGKIKPKLWFISGGILLIESLYIGRLAWLTIISKKVAESAAAFSMAEYSGRVHDNLNIALYILIVVLFIIYARYVAGPRRL